MMPATHTNGRKRAPRVAAARALARGLFALSLVASLTHCGPRKVTVVPPAGVPATDCPAPDGDPEQRYQAGLARWEQGRQGEHIRTVDRQAAMAEFLAAARGGHAMAQYKFGLRTVSDHFQEQGPDPASPTDKALYIEGLKWIGVAAARGLPKALKVYQPWLIKALTDPDAQVVPDPEDAMATVPMPWIREAARQARALRPCWPDVEP